MKQETLMQGYITKIDKVLKNLNIQYLIILEDGTRFGNIQGLPTNKRQLKYKFGELKQYVGPFLVNVKISQEQMVPYGKFEKPSIASAVTTYAAENWGVGSYTYRCKEDGLHIMRLL